MLHRTTLLSTSLIVLSLVIVLSVIWRGGKTGIAFQGESLAFACEINCSQTELRTPVAEISWRATQADLDQEALEVTVYKNGFQRGLFARLSPIRRDQKFALVAPPEQQQQGVIGLNQLVLASVIVSDEDGRVRVLIKGLEPGLNYFFRLRSADGVNALSETIRCTTPACPADEEAAPTPNPPR